MGPEGNFALAEVKGVGTGVRREHVNKLDTHREKAGHGPDELPGLLVINQFRNDSTLEARQREIGSDIVTHLVRFNVLALRGVDLYRLLGLRLASTVGPELLVDALSGGGGWLQVTEETADIHK